DHIVRAAAVAHGQIVARSGSYVAGTGGLVLAPASINAAAGPAACFAFRNQQTADCAKPRPSPPTLVSMPSGAARYYPVYYGIVGLPSIPFPSALGIYLMRLVGGLGSAALAASALL